MTSQLHGRSPFARTSKRHHSHRGAFRAAAVAGALFILAGCVPGQPTGDGTTLQTPSPEETVFFTETEVADIMDGDEPAGWTETVDESKTGLEYLASENGGVGFDSASIRATRIAPSVLDATGYRYAGQADTYSFNRVFQTWYREMDRSSSHQELEELDYRTVDGNPARGYTYVDTTDEAAPTRYEIWLVARRDGVWRITITSSPGQRDLPEGFTEAFLDSITWTAPTA